MRKTVIFSCISVIAFSFLLQANAEVISFEANKESYTAGENIIFDGIVQKKDLDEDATVTIVINDPEGQFVLVTQAKPDHAGSFQAVIDSLSKFQVNGTYHVTAYTSKENQGLSTSFDLIIIKSLLPDVTLYGPSVIKTQKLIIGGKDVFLDIQSPSKISGFIFDENQKQISFTVTGEKETNGIVILPISQVLKGPYVVTIDDKIWRDYETFEDEYTNDTFIRIRYPSSHEITITGAEVVPEFSTVALVFAASIIITIGFSLGMKRFKMSFNTLK